MGLFRLCDREIHKVGLISRNDHIVFGEFFRINLVDLQRLALLRLDPHYRFDAVAMYAQTLDRNIIFALGNGRNADGMISVLVKYLVNDSRPGMIATIEYNQHGVFG